MRLLARRPRTAAVLVATTAGLGATGIAAAGADTTTTAPDVRSMRVAVVLMRLPGISAQPVSKAALHASTFGATNSVADWYSQMSGGQVAVTGTVYGYYGGVRSCDLSTELSAAAAAATAGGIRRRELRRSRRVHARPGMRFLGHGLDRGGWRVPERRNSEPRSDRARTGPQPRSEACRGVRLRRRGVFRLPRRLRRSRRRDGRPDGRPRLQRRAQVHARLDPGGGGPDGHDRSADDRPDGVGESAGAGIDRADPRTRRRRHVVRDRSAGIGWLRRGDRRRMGSPGRVGGDGRHGAAERSCARAGPDVLGPGPQGEHHHHHRLRPDRVDPRLCRQLRDSVDPERRRRSGRDLGAEHCDRREDVVGELRYHADRAVRSRRRRGSYGDRLDVREPARRPGQVQRQPRQPVRREHRQSRCAATHRVLGDTRRSACDRAQRSRSGTRPSTARRFRVPTTFSGIRSTAGRPFKRPRARTAPSPARARPCAPDNGRSSCSASFSTARAAGFTARSGLRGIGAATARSGARGSRSTRCSKSCRRPVRSASGEHCRPLGNGERAESSRSSPRSRRVVARSRVARTAFAVRVRAAEPLTRVGPYRAPTPPAFPDHCGCVRTAHDRQRGGARARLLLVAQGRLRNLGDRRGRGARARPRGPGAHRRSRRRSAGRARARDRSRSGSARLAARRARGAHRRARPARGRRRAAV